MRRSDFKAYSMNKHNEEQKWDEADQTFIDTICKMLNRNCVCHVFTEDISCQKTHREHVSR